MSHATVSSKYQIVIPKDVRERVRVRPGQRMSVTVKGGVIHLIPVPTLQELRGIARGADTRGVRDKEDRV